MDPAGCCGILWLLADRGGDPGGAVGNPPNRSAIMKYWIGCAMFLLAFGCASHTAHVAAPIAQTAPPPAPLPPVSFDIYRGIELHWLDNTPPTMERGVSWGVPWPQGAGQRTSTFAMVDGLGKDVPIQTWPLAYWPDGSIKWTAVAAVLGPGSGRNLKLFPAGIPASY